jgi:TolB-like protein
MDRRLAAILVADVVGYSRLLEVNEAAILATLKRCRTQILEPLVASHKGRIVKLIGDGALLEFSSAVSALECACAFQASMASANEALPMEKQIAFRIGLNLGEVVVEGDDIYGEGVNVAARLEALSEPGGVCLSESVFKQVRGKTSITFTDMGEQSLKNIAEPVRAYRALTVPHAGQLEPKYQAGPAKPSIAVLPFANLSGDPEQEYFADGITEDIITELARFSSLFVIARNSSFQYRGKSQDMKKVGRELGASYLVEGSVRRLGPHIRITAQLIDATTGRHVWAERYDRRLEDLFEVQDEVVRAVVTCSEHRIADSEAEQIARRSPSNWAAYDFFLQARWYLAQFETYEKAEEPLLRAIELDPKLAEAYAMLTHVEMGKYWQDQDNNHITKAFGYARQSLALNSTSSDAHNAMSLVYVFKDRLDLALQHVDRALAVNPNNTLAAVNRAQWIAFSGRCSEAINELELIAKRDPLPPSWYWDAMGSSLFQLRRYQQSIDAYNMVRERQPWQMAYVAASLAYLGRAEDAQHEIQALLTTHPTMTISRILMIERWPSEEARHHFVQGLINAGLPQ